MSRSFNIYVDRLQIGNPKQLRLQEQLNLFISIFFYHKNRNILFAIQLLTFIHAQTQKLFGYNYMNKLLRDITWSTAN